MTGRYDHSKVAQQVAEVLDDNGGTRVVEVSGSPSKTKQWVETESRLHAFQLVPVLEETGCAVTHFKDHGSNWRTWFGYVDVGLDGPSFVDR